MRFTLQHLMVIALVVSLVPLAYGLNYMYFTDSELTVLNERIRFTSADTLSCARTNDCFPFSSQPQVDPQDYAIMGTGCYGWRHDPHLVFNAPDLPFPRQAGQIRQLAHLHGYFFSQGSNMQALAHLQNRSIHYWFWPVGTPFDSSGGGNYLDLPDSAVVFFDTPTLTLSGTVVTTLILGVSGDAALEDNIVYQSSSPPWGQLALNHPEKFALVAEGSIDIVNSWANGRENSNGRGNSQTDPDSTGIALNGLYFALGESFTFLQQNDEDSGYVYQDPPGTPHSDDRGTIYLSGAVVEKQRGYVHRSTNSSTGYLKHYVNDESLKFWHVGVFDTSVHENVVTPTSIAFGSTPAGHTLRDTISIENEFVPLTIDSVRASLPFSIVRPDSYRWQQKIVVAFSPDTARAFHDTVRFYLGYYHQWFKIPVSGTATPSNADPVIFHPSSFILTCSPNPFNPQTRLSFTLPQSEMVNLGVYDLSGRRVAALLNERMEPGEHSEIFDGTALPSGLYFARLTTPDQAITQKLLLVK